MMEGFNQSSIRKAGSPMMMLIWKKVYDTLCMDCKKKLFVAASDIKLVGTAAVTQRMQEILDNHLCQPCKNRVEAIMKKYDR